MPRVCEVCGKVETDDIETIDSQDEVLQLCSDCLADRQGEY